MLGKTERFIFLYNYTDYGAGLYSSGSILFSRCGVFYGYGQSKLIHGVHWRRLDKEVTGMDKTTSITTIKKEMQLQEWSAQIKAQQASGLTIRKCFCVNADRS